MTSLNETPNLLELAEAYRGDVSAISGLSESATCDEKTGGYSLCADANIELSLCADKG